MFGSNHGPFLMRPNEKSYIDQNLNIDVYIGETQLEAFSNFSNFTILSAVFRSDYDHRYSAIPGFCNGKMPEWVVDLNVKHYRLNLLKPAQLINPELGLTSNNYSVGKVQLHDHYQVTNKGWYTVVIELCNIRDDSLPGLIIAPSVYFNGAVGEVTGELGFHNPYGYVAAVEYGILPFLYARMIAYTLTIFYFVYYYFKHRKQSLPVHHGILVVLVIALLESGVWLYTYVTLNIDGRPTCCPFPKEMIASLCSMVIRETAVRSLLLVVSLGYGIARPKLIRAETIAVFVISAIYFISTLLAQVSNIVAMQEYDTTGNQTVGSDTTHKYANMVSMGIDLIFLTWIYLALTSTLRILKEFRQIVKLEMYEKLVQYISIYASMFCIVSLATWISDMGFYSYPWQIEWLPKVLWETLNTVVLLALCTICRPTENSLHLSYSAQIPTHDPDDDEDFDVDDLDFSGVEMTRNVLFQHRSTAEEPVMYADLHKDITDTDFFKPSANTKEFEDFMASASDDDEDYIND